MFRADGVWGGKSRGHLFKWRADHEFDERPLHSHWAPLNSRHKNKFPHADLIKYHLRMIRPQDRLERRRKFEAIDPDCRWQSSGYAYLTDTTGLRLEALPPGRGYEPMLCVPKAVHDI